MDMIDRIIAREGGARVTNYATDPGGLTKYGISRRAHPGVDIYNLTYTQARDIYTEEYLVKSGIGSLDIPDDLKEAILDFAVHSGPATAIKYVQKLINTDQDGVIGEQTRAAIKDINAPALQKALAIQRALFLARQVVSNPKKLDFLVGWLNRALSFL